MRNDQLMMQIKKERLDKHLVNVEELMKAWILQLSAPDPFGFSRHTDRWGWQSPYEADAERNPDENLMLRKHLKSRALWKHHSDWRWRLDRVFDISAGVRMKATELYDRARPTSSPNHRAHTKDYLPTALWQAFRLARKEAPNIDYTRGDGGKGVRFGGYVIETSSESKAKFTTICEGHRDLSRMLSELNEMKELAEEWALVSELQSRMHTLVGKALKSSDYLYPCTFCKHLWRP